MSALSTTASVVIREFTIRKIDMEIIFDVLNGNVLMDMLWVLIISSSTAHLVFLLALETEQITVTSAAVGPLFVLLVLVLRYWVRLLLLTNIKHVCLRLKVLNAEIRCQNVFGQLLLELLFDFLAEFLVHHGVIWIKFCQDDHFEASNDSLFLEFEFLRNLHHFFIFHVKLLKILRFYIGILLSFEKFAYRVKITSLPNLLDLDEVHQRLKLVTWLFNCKFDAILVIVQIMFINKS